VGRDQAPADPVPDPLWDAVLDDPRAHTSAVDSAGAPKTSKSKYRSPADFDLTLYDLCFRYSGVCRSSSARARSSRASMACRSGTENRDARGRRHHRGRRAAEDIQMSATHQDKK
jgi:hypothetical protein